MARLIKGIYGTEFRRTGDLFGLYCGQMHVGSTRVIKNGGWYNRSGEKLGFGDLSAADFQRISDELEDGELFIVLGEEESFWNFVNLRNIIGACATTKPDIEAPGVEYIAKHCRYIITKGRAYNFVDFKELRTEAVEVYNGVTFQVLLREEAKKLIANS